MRRRREVERRDLLLFVLLVPGHYRGRVVRASIRRSWEEERFHLMAAPAAASSTSISQSNSLSVALSLSASLLCCVRLSVWFTRFQSNREPRKRFWFSISTEEDESPGGPSWLDYRWIITVHQVCFDEWRIKRWPWAIQFRLSGVLILGYIWPFGAMGCLSFRTMRYI